MLSILCVTRAEPYATPVLEALRICVMLNASLLAVMEQVTFQAFSVPLLDGHVTGPGLSVYWMKLLKRALETTSSCLR